jgi:hypothetical protein
MTQKIESIQDWLIRHGHHPADTVNGEPLLDLLWKFWVDSINERTKIRTEGSLDMPDYCNACKRPFDEVHLFDFMNDYTCREMHDERSVQTYPNGYRPCMKDHTWREHVQESYSRRGQVWFNPHYRVAERLLKGEQ